MLPPKVILEGLYHWVYSDQKLLIHYGWNYILYYQRKCIAVRGPEENKERPTMEEAIIKLNELLKKDPNHQQHEINNPVNP